MPKIAVVDIETTRFLDNGGLIVEVGIVSLDLITGVVKEEFNSLVREDSFSRKHTEGGYGWIFKNSDLTFEAVDKAPSLIEMLPKIQEVLDKFPLGATAFNKKFDFGFLKNRGLKITELPCIMLTATPVVKAAGKRGGYKWPTVEEAWDHFFPLIPYDELHRGLDDAKHEACIAYRLYKSGDLEIDLPQSSNQPIPVK